MLFCLSAIFGCYNGTLKGNDSCINAGCSGRFKSKLLFYTPECKLTFYVFFFNMMFWALRDSVCLTN